MSPNIYLAHKLGGDYQGLKFSITDHDSRMNAVLTLLVVTLSGGPLRQTLSSHRLDELEASAPSSTEILAYLAECLKADYGVYGLKAERISRGLYAQGLHGIGECFAAHYMGMKAAPPATFEHPTLGSVPLPFETSKRLALYKGAWLP